MKVKTLRYKRKVGWLDELPIELNSRQTLLLVFGASSFGDDLTPFHQLANAFSDSKIIGCSTAGEIFGQSIDDESLVIGVIQFEKTHLKSALAPVIEMSESFRAGEEIAQQLNSPHLRGVIVLSDGLNVNGSKLVAGISASLSSSIAITGGLAADGDRFERTWVLNDVIPKSNFVSAIGFYGNSIKIGHGSKGGWDIFGPERLVTKSEGNKLFEVDGNPALQLYKRYLGDLEADLPASALLFPLSMRRNEKTEKRIVRTVLGVEEESQSMVFAGDIPEGSLVQLMRANFDRLIDGAAAASLMANTYCENDGNVFSIAISCVGRRLILGERSEEELEAVMESLPQQTQQIGFYSYGEISPYKTGYCDLHNQTMTLTTICEQ